MSSALIKTQIERLEGEENQPRPKAWPLLYDKPLGDASDE